MLLLYAVYTLYYTLYSKKTAISIAYRDFFWYNVTILPESVITMIVRFLLENVSLPKIMPRICGRRQCPPGWRIDRQNQQGYNFHFVFSGSGIFTKGGITYNIGKGDMFICRPGDDVTYCASVTDPWDFGWIVFRCGAELDSLLPAEVLHVPETARIFEQMADAVDKPAKEWLVSGLLYQLFAILADAQGQRCAEQSYLSKAVSYIESNYNRNLQVTDIAEMLGLNRSYFCRVFKRQMGMSPQDYIVSYRLEQAEKLLTTTKLSQKEIALRVGYPDVYALSRMFKRRYGIAPGKFRELHLNKK